MTTLRRITARLALSAATSPLQREYDKLHKHFTNKIGRATERGTGYPSKAFWQFKIPNPENIDSAKLNTKLYLKTVDGSEEVDKKPKPKGSDLLVISIYAMYPTDAKIRVKAESAPARTEAQALANLKLAISRANRDPDVTGRIIKFLGL